ncbi:hypothetical protein C8J57DRAFT_1495026 [Mycena rebaudengoi]|nr:hypothetical protein C8J57DRAFT_1495026 [Mycena rebaudengoi]
MRTAPAPQSAAIPGRGEARAVLAGPADAVDVLENVGSYFRARIFIAPTTTPPPNGLYHRLRLRHAQWAAHIHHPPDDALLSVPLPARNRKRHPTVVARKLSLVRRRGYMTRPRHLARRSRGCTVRIRATSRVRNGAEASARDVPADRRAAPCVRYAAAAASDVLSRIRRTNYPASGLRRVASRPKVPNGFTRCPECKGAGVEKERRPPDATVAAALGAVCSVRRAVRVVLGADGGVERKSTSGASPRATCSRVWAYTRRGRSEAESSPPPAEKQLLSGAQTRVRVETEMGEEKNLSETGEAGCSYAASRCSWCGVVLLPFKSEVT